VFARGLLKGIAVGGLGLLTCPFKFVFKFTSAVTGTVADTSTLIFKGAIQKYGRARSPRFLGQTGVLTGYSEELARINAVLIKHRGKYRHVLVYYSTYSLEKDYNQEDGIYIAAIVTTDSFLYFVNGKLEKNIKIEEIKCLQLHFVEKMYFLCVATTQQNFSIPARSLKHLQSVYTIIMLLRRDCDKIEELAFERPSFIAFNAKTN
jgi:hypothetical protein